MLPELEYAEIQIGDENIPEETENIMLFGSCTIREAFKQYIDLRRWASEIIYRTEEPVWYLLYSLHDDTVTRSMPVIDIRKFGINKTTLQDDMLNLDVIWNDVQKNMETFTQAIQSRTRNTEDQHIRIQVTQVPIVCCLIVLEIVLRQKKTYELIIP